MTSAWQHEGPQHSTAMKEHLRHVLTMQHTSHRPIEWDSWWRTKKKVRSCSRGATTGQLLLDTIRRCHTQVPTHHHCDIIILKCFAILTLSSRTSMILTYILFHLLSSPSFTNSHPPFLPAHKHTHRSHTDTHTHTAHTLTYTHTHTSVSKRSGYDSNIHLRILVDASQCRQISIFWASSFFPFLSLLSSSPPFTNTRTHWYVKQKWLWFKYTSKDLSWRKSVQTNIHILSLFLYPSPILPFAFSYSRPHLSWLYNVTACLHNQKVLSLFNPTCPLASTHHSHYNFFRTTAKFFDLAPEDEIELKSLKLNLFLNLASCYIKLENWDQVIILFMRTVMFNKHVQEQVPYPSRTSLSNLTTSLSPRSWGLNMI